MVDIQLPTRSEPANYLVLTPAQIISGRTQYKWLNEKEEQIVGTQEKSQQIVAQRLLSCLQYLDATKSSAKDLSNPPVNL